MENYVTSLNLNKLDKSHFTYIIPIKEMYYIQHKKTPMSSKELLIDIGQNEVIFAIEGSDCIGEHIYKAIIKKEFLDQGIKYFPFHKKYKEAHQIDYSGVLFGNKIFGRYYEQYGYSIHYEPQILAENSIENHNFCFHLDMISFIGFDEEGKFISIAFDKENFNNKNSMKFAIMSSSTKIGLFRGNFISPHCLELIDVFNYNYSVTINFSPCITSLCFVDNVFSKTGSYYSYYLRLEE